MVVAGGGHENISLVGSFVQCHDLVAFHRSLQSTNGIDLGYPDLGAQRRQCLRSEEHTSELQSLMSISYAVFCLKKKNNTNNHISQLIKHDSQTTQNTRPLR